MNESHPWRDGSQTILFVLIMPVVLMLAYAAEHLVGWVTYGKADAPDRRRQRLHVVALGAVATLIAGVGSGDPTLVLGCAGATVALLACLELAHGAVLLSQRVTGGPRRRSAA